MIIIFVIIFIVVLMFFVGLFSGIGSGLASGVGLVVKMRVWDLLSPYTPVVFVISLLATMTAVMALGSSISVYTAETGSWMSSSRSNPGKSVANSGCLPWLSILCHLVHLQCPNQFFSSVIPRLQICPVWCFLGPPPATCWLYLLLAVV